MLQPGTLLDLGRGRDALDLACEPDTQWLLLGGAPFGEVPLLWWNFVARPQAEIEQALADWNHGDARFGPVPGSPAPRLVAPPLGGVRIKAER